MDDVIYKQCVDHITYLNNQIEILTRQKNVAEQRIAQKYHENGILMKSLEEERNSRLEKSNALNNLAAETEKMQIRYKSQIQDYAQLRESMNLILKEKEDLKCKLEKSENDNIQLTSNIFELETKITGDLQSRSSDLE